MAFELSDEIILSFFFSKKKQIEVDFQKQKLRPFKILTIKKFASSFSMNELQTATSISK